MIYESSCSTLFRLILCITMITEIILSVSQYKPLVITFSFIGYLLATIIQIYPFLTNNNPRSYYILRELSWTSNIVVVFIFWCGLYNKPDFKTYVKDNYTYVLILLFHILPIIGEVKEMYIKRIHYKKGDYFIILLFFMFYGVFYIADLLITGIPLYPILTCHDLLSLCIIMIIIGISYLSYFIGCYLDDEKKDMKEVKND